MVFARAINRILNDQLDLSAQTIKVALMRDTLTPNQVTQEFFADISSNQSTVSGGGSGYTAGGATLTNKTFTPNPSAGTASFDADDVTWAITGGTITARYAVVYQDSGNPATSPIIAVFDFGSNRAATDGNFTLQWGANGIIQGIGI
jgi:hypothetical protein